MCCVRGTAQKAVVFAPVSRVHELQDPGRPGQALAEGWNCCPVLCHVSPQQDLPRIQTQICLTLKLVLSYNIQTKRQGSG